jgi:hypothetical protein
MRIKLGRLGQAEAQHPRDIDYRGEIMCFRLTTAPSIVWPALATHREMLDWKSRLLGTCGASLAEDLSSRSIPTSIDPEVQSSSRDMSPQVHFHDSFLVRLRPPAIFSGSQEPASKTSLF